MQLRLTKSHHACLDLHLVQRCAVRPVQWSLMQILGLEINMTSRRPCWDGHTVPEPVLSAALLCLFPHSAVLHTRCRQVVHICRSPFGRLRHVCRVQPILASF